MENTSVVGIDLAKRVYHLVGMNRTGKLIWHKRIARAGLMEFLVQLPKCRIAMEACGGAHHLGRQLQSLEQEVKLIAPQFVKPFVKSNKNDWRDAEAIAEAAQRPEMRFSAVKSIVQQDLQFVHRGRERCIKARTATVNAIHALLLEYGIAVRLGALGMVEAASFINSDKLSSLASELLARLIKQLRETEEEIKFYDDKIAAIAKAHPVCRRLMTIPGIGEKTSTAIIATVSDPSLYKNGRAFSASLGLVPKQHSTGGKTRLGGISKRGDRYVRRLLVHGARAVVFHAQRKEDKRSRWVIKLLAAKGSNRTAVAVANKNARIIWSLLRYGTEYQAA
jgi:transposase